MSILINKTTRLIVQGITGRDGRFHTQKMKAYGTNIVGGTSPGKGGTSVEGIPIFNTMYEAVEQTKANTSIIFVPARFAADAMMEAADAGIQLIICISEGVPTLDVVKAYHYINSKGAMLIGPNCPGLMSPEESLTGILPGQIFKKGNIGVISRSGTLTYEIVYHLTNKGLGQSTAIGMGGDPVVGLYFCELLKMFQGDPETEAIVLIGEIGGNAEEQAAEYIKKHVSKPVVGFIAGQAAPVGKQMGHAGAIISSGSGTAQEKISALEAAGVKVAKEPSEIPEMLIERLCNK
ncbi:succinate--CoA ligase subunit alpha [Dysgonomonas sp. Marseille-P4361]|uniref:succinate--CoA ligase subunit alpha n=1 Tax=Dysgonomonas sp. Marseille-P4361 TaxID=2161820 RepID=UPI000D54E1F3|nr:succinate--CoA ligase subunit alpha [Dysgonomonas sp. Marseille-P4361]